MRPLAAVQFTAPKSMVMVRGLASVSKVTVGSQASSALAQAIILHRLVHLGEHVAEGILGAGVVAGAGVVQVERFSFVLVAGGQCEQGDGGEGEQLFVQHGVGCFVQL